MQTNIVTLSLVFFELVATGFGPQAFAAKGLPVEAEKCLNALLKAGSIPHTPQDSFATDLESSGVLLNRGEDWAAQLKNWRVGSYIYILSNHGELVISRQYFAKNYTQTGQGVATHPSLLERWDIARVLAAGEIRLVGGRIQHISNRSGNFRGEPERLEKTIELLQSKKVLFAPGFEKKVYSKGTEEDRGHTPKNYSVHQAQLEWASTVENSPELLQLRLKYDELLRILLDAQNRSGVDKAQNLNTLINELCKLLMDSIEIKSATPDGNNNWMRTYEDWGFFILPLQSVTTVDGIDMGLSRMSEHENAKGVFGSMVERILTLDTKLIDQRARREIKSLLNYTK